jgi:hypothetical protein
MKAGMYYFGDLCYLFPHPYEGAVRWQELCSKEFNESHMCALSTHWGDGEYYSNQGHVIPVDSGSIGVISVSGFVDVSEEWSEYVDAAVRSGSNYLIEFEEDFECYSKQGVLNFGHITVDTDLEEEEEEEEEDWEEEER